MWLIIDGSEWVEEKKVSIRTSVMGYPSHPQIWWKIANVCVWRSFWVLGEEIIIISI